MTTQDNGAIPGWDMDRPIGIVTQAHDAATVMDGIKLGLGMAIAWLVMVPLIVAAIFIALGSIG